MKKRTLNEIRQSKEFQIAKANADLQAEVAKSTKEAIANQQAINRSLQNKEVFNTEVDLDEAVYEIVENLTTHMFDIIFQTVNDEMHKYTVFQSQTYLTNEGMDMFEDQWFEFYHEHHGEILGRIMKTLTN